MSAPRVWFNKTFSSVYNVFRLLRDPAAPVQPYIYCTHSNHEFLGFELADEAMVEPAGLKEAAYVGWCLDTCREKRIDIFVPGKAAAAIALRRDEFAAAGVKLQLAADGATMDLFEDKARFYRELDSAVALAPVHEVVTTGADFAAAVARVQASGRTACLKPSRSTGGLGFRILDDTKSDLRNLINGEPVRITTALATSILSAEPSFRELLVMEYLDGPEYSIDCLATDGVLHCAIPRRKPVRAGGSQLLEAPAELLALAERLTRAYRLHALFNIQVRYIDGAPKLLEINARMSGGIYFTCLSGVNLPSWAVALAIGAVTPELIPQPAYGLRVGQQFHEFKMQHSQPELLA